MSTGPKRIIVLYNTDYDLELTAGTGIDVSSVQASAQAILQGLREAGHDATLLGNHGLELFANMAALLHDPPDVIFNLCESMAGDARNEPLVPALLDLLKLPYTGSDALALGSCLHKQRTKEILTGRGVSTPPYRFFRTLADLHDPTLAKLDFPWFLKLAHEDASVGIEADNLVRDLPALVKRATYMMQEWKQPVLAERYIDGREVNVTLIGDTDSAEVLPLHEIDFAGMPADRPRIVSYAAKWDEHHVDYAGTKPVPLAGVDEDLAMRIRTTAREAWLALGLRDYGRVDLRIDAGGTPWVIDVNPNCDISPDAGVARAAALHGWTFPTLMSNIATGAWRRWRR